MAKGVRQTDNRIEKRRVAGTFYVEGSAARKLQIVQPLPEIEKKRRQEEEQERQKRQEEQQQRINRANHRNFLYTAVVIGIVAVIFLICWQYLTLQSEVKTNAAEVARMTAQLQELTAQNDETQIKIQAGINYDSIYDIATQELGMMHPKKSQVITYNPGISEYVKQYQEIPEAK